jgi:hypothetical protein
MCHPINSVYLRKLPVVLLLFAAIPSAVAQKIEQHRWKERLILIFAPNEDDPAYLEQVARLQDSDRELKARKVVVYQILPLVYNRGINTRVWQTREAGTLAGIRAEDGFGILLIGLDGGVKLRSRQVVNPEKLWALIDTMPMRKAERKDKGLD